MPINTYDTTKEVYYTERYKTLVRSEKEFLLKNCVQFPLENRAEVFAFRRDIYRLLRTINVEPHLYWTVAYLNGIENPDQDISHLREILVIQENVLEKIIVRSNSASR